MMMHEIRPINNDVFEHIAYDLVDASGKHSLFGVDEPTRALFVSRTIARFNELLLGEEFVRMTRTRLSAFSDFLDQADLPRQFRIAVKVPGNFTKAEVREAFSKALAENVTNGTPVLVGDEESSSVIADLLNGEEYQPSRAA
ncbi:hypothetical protein Q4F19_04185 [Sphingomonas sp. BIUV-7]|uniref:Uncharacterized protein n=1 Tax=Sphingomonas natans TaxID=3063330 RepID=A0ABT8Y5I2_9SPHN|nr:hypothetical protein [Sphingomonas sp. BIUV-7]MDO6413574.1 hypothetical protein [Sphingomonas sp. BIUV-7]